MNSAQLFFGRHFPEILNQDPDPETNEYSVKNPLNSYKNEMKIDKDGFFNAKNPPFSGYFTEYLSIAEGIPEDEIEQEFDKCKNNEFPPTSEQIINWHEKLLAPEGKTLLDYLMNERGLSIDTIKKQMLGFNENDSELVFPVNNITNTNPVTVKFTKFPFTPTVSKNKIRIVGPSVLFGYHQLKFNRDHRTLKYITINEIDALYLRQLGFEAYCSMTELCDLLRDWHPLFENQDVIIFTSYEEESLINTAELALDNLKSIKRVKLGGKYITDYFIQKNHSIDEFNQKIKDTPGLNSAYFESMKTLQAVDAVRNDNEIIHGSQSFSRLGFVYGAKFNDEYFYLISNGKFLDEKRFNEYGVSKKNEFSYSGITRELAKKITQDNQSVKAKHVFNAIRSYIKKYIFFQDESVYDLLAIWSMGTYVFSIFRYFPYINIQAEPNSGKSQFMIILAEICFNGKHYVSLTGPVIFREAENLLRTMFLDEFERASRRNQNDIMELLNSGFQKGATVPRIAPAAKGGTVDYSVYCPKMFAGINDINDVLQSRSIKVKILRKLPDEKVEKYTNDDPTAKLQKHLREDLYMFGLGYAEEIRDMYNNKIQSIENLKALENRQLDIWSPIFTIATIVDRENNNSLISDSLSAYVKHLAKQQSLNEQLDNPTTILLSKINETFNSVAYVKKDENDGQIILEYLTDDILEVFKKDPDWKKEITSKQKLSRILRKVGITVKNGYVNGKPNIKSYVVDVAKLTEFGKRYAVQLSIKH